MSNHDPSHHDDEPTAWATHGLFLVNVSVFMAMWMGGAGALLVAPGALVAWGGASAMEIWQGEVWRLLSTMFVHGAIWHLGLNMWVFLQVGKELERLLGPSRFLLLYLASGLFGSALSLLIHPQLSVGASGAIFGVVGGLLAYAARNRGRRIGRAWFAALTPFVLVTLIVGFLVPFIDNSAHVGGLLAGFLLGYGLLPGDRNEDAAPAAGSWVALAAAGVALVALIPMALQPGFNPNYETALGWASLRAGKTEAARAHAENASKLAPDDPEVLILFARLAMADDAPTAKALFAQAVEALDEPDDAALMAKVSMGMVGGQPEGDIAWAFDARTTRGLCDALLDRANQKPAAAIANNCAWVMVKSTDSLVRDVQRGLALARRAVRLEMNKSSASTESSAETLGAYLHTLAVAHAESGDLEEARITLERLQVMGVVDDNPIYQADLERFTSLTRPRRGSSTAADGTAAAPARDGGPPEAHPEADGGHFGRNGPESAMMDAGEIDHRPE